MSDTLDSSAEMTTVQAMSTSQFIGSIGLASHLDAFGTGDSANYANVVTDMQYLGVNLLRSGAAMDFDGGGGQAYADEVETAIARRNSSRWLPWIPDRLPGGQDQRQHARPDRKIVIRLVVDGRPDAYLGRRLVQHQPQDRGRLQLLLGGRPDIGSTARHQSVGEFFERVQLRIGIVHHLGAAQRHHRAIVHRVVETGSGHHQPVQDADSETDIHAACLRGQHPAGRRSVPVDMIIPTPIGRRSVNRHAKGALTHSRCRSGKIGGHDAGRCHATRFIPGDLA